MAPQSRSDLLHKYSKLEGCILCARQALSEAYVLSEGVPPRKAAIGDLIGITDELHRDLEKITYRLRAELS